MRVSYWSNSKFAKALRKVFGLPPQLECGTIEQWNEIEIEEKRISLIGIRVIESLNTVQKIVYWIPDTFSKAVYWVSNWKNSSHVLKTSVKVGNWGDLTSKIPDALMYAIIEFIETECFSMGSWDQEDVKAYNDQSYIRRRLFPVKIASSLREKYGREYIKFQIDNGADAEAYGEILAAYSFDKNRYFRFDPYEESGWNEIISIQGEGSFMRFTDEQKACYKIIDELEMEFHRQTTEHCTNLVKHRGFLWT